MVSTEISKAPVDTSWDSMALEMKKSIMQAYNLFSIAQANRLGVESGPKYTKGLKEANRHTMRANLVYPKSWASCHFQVGGGKFSPSMARVGYFCCSRPAYCSNTLR